MTVFGGELGPINLWDHDCVCLRISLARLRSRARGNELPTLGDQWLGSRTALLHRDRLPRVP